MNASIWIYLALAGIFFGLLLCYRRTGRTAKCVVFTAVTGIGTLLALRLLGGVMHTPLALTPLSVLISGVLGIPGVIGMLVLYLI